MRLQDDNTNDSNRREYVILILQYCMYFINIWFNSILMWHDVSVSLTAAKESYTKDAPQNQPEKEVKQEKGEGTPGHPGYGANKKFPYIDEWKW